MEEIWKDIEGYEGLYQISSIGRVKVMPRSFYSKANQIFTVNEKFRRMNSDKDGYHAVVLTKDKKIKGFRVHRLMATAFLPNPENRPVVNHKNGIKYDNRIENLEWATHSENVLHSYATGLQEAVRGDKHPCSMPVLNTETGIYYESVDEAYRSYGRMAYTTFYSHLNGFIKTNRTPFIYI